MVATILPSDLAYILSPGEHLVLLMGTGRFDRLLRKDDLLDEDVAAVFGLVDGKVELLALCFHSRRFSLPQATSWLAERGFGPPATPARFPT